jgi:hypothetical protein
MKKPVIRPGFRAGKWVVTGMADDQGNVPVACECGRTEERFPPVYGFLRH